jgi:hypothetical protein
LDLDVHRERLGGCGVLLGSIPLASDTYLLLIFVAGYRKPLCSKVEFSKLYLDFPTACEQETEGQILPVGGAKFLNVKNAQISFQAVIHGQI